MMNVGNFWHATDRDKRGKTRVTTILIMPTRHTHRDAHITQGPPGANSVPKKNTPFSVHGHDGPEKKSFDTEHDLINISCHSDM